MNESKIIMLQSITYATKARNTLFKSGIRADITKTPKSYSESGCGYSLVVPYKGDAAINLLNEKGFVILGVVDSGSF